MPSAPLRNGPDSTSSGISRRKNGTPFAREPSAATENDQDLEKIRQSGKVNVYTPTPAESLEWKKALMPVHKEMESRVGKDTVAAAYKAAGFVPV